MKHGTFENGNYGNKHKLNKTENLLIGNTNINNLNMGKYKIIHTVISKSGSCERNYASNKTFLLLLSQSGKFCLSKG
jgi:hypothetical protein